MDAIYLAGKERLGKSTTLLDLINYIRQKNYTITNYENSKGKDRRAAFKIKEKIVSITTYGDSDYIIGTNINYATKNNADILITATRSKGATVNKLVFDKNISQKIRINKSIDYSTTQAQTNQKDLDEIIKILNKKFSIII